MAIGYLYAYKYGVEGGMVVGCLVACTGMCCGCMAAFLLGRHCLQARAKRAIATHPRLKVGKIVQYARLVRSRDVDRGCHAHGGRLRQVHWW